MPDRGPPGVPVAAAPRSLYGDDDPVRRRLGRARTTRGTAEGLDHDGTHRPTRYGSNSTCRSTPCSAAALTCRTPVGPSALTSCRASDTMTSAVERLAHRVVRMTGRDLHEPGRVATSLELLFDLTFVVAFGVAGNEAAHLLAEGTSGRRWPGSASPCSRSPGRGSTSPGSPRPSTRRLGLPARPWSRWSGWSSSRSPPMFASSTRAPRWTTA